MEPNPFLPNPVGVLTFRHTRQWRAEGGARFYRATLELSQSHWQQGRPAQAILQLNKAFLSDLDEGAEVLEEWPWPYEALVWYLQRAGEESVLFWGNPVRHFQHLATRMRGPRHELRAVRAWVCFVLARGFVNEVKNPIDSLQMRREGVVFPKKKDLVKFLLLGGRPREAKQVEGLFAQLEEAGGGALGILAQRGLGEVE